VLRSHRERPSTKTTYVQRRAILRVEGQTISTFWVLVMIAVISRSIFAVESIIFLSHTRVKVGEVALKLASLLKREKLGIRETMKLRMAIPLCYS
jgi:hypothetical protein